jgi:hypothetical protein
MGDPNTESASRLVRSYILRVLEQRTLRIELVYELHDIEAGKRRRFSSLPSLERHMARQRSSGG